MTGTVEGKFIGGLHAERLECITVLRDRLRIWRCTPIGHWSGRGAVYRHEAGIGVEAQHKKEHDECACQHRKRSMSMYSHAVSLSHVQLNRQRYSFEGKRLSRPVIERQMDLVVERIVAALVDVVHDAEW